MDLKVVGWTDYESNYPSITVSNEELNDVLVAVVDAIRDGGYMFSGDDHQCGLSGVPVFDNGSCFRASMRAWGTIMTYAYPEFNGEKTGYMDFYMSTVGERKLPDCTSCDIEPMESDNFNALITPQDSEMISQSVQMGIPFMTTDKALNSLMDEINEAMEQMGGCDCGCEDDCDCEDGCDCDCEDGCDCNDTDDTENE